MTPRGVKLRLPLEAALRLPQHALGGGQGGAGGAQFVQLGLRVEPREQLPVLDRGPDADEALADPSGDAEPERHRIGRLDLTGEVLTAPASAAATVTVRTGRMGPFEAVSSSPPQAETSAASDSAAAVRARRPLIAWPPRAGRASWRP